jgi:hypothetical protein
MSLTMTGLNLDDTFAAWTDVQGRFFQCFSLYIWIARVHPFITNPHPTVIAVKNAAVESSIMTVRDIDDFFSARKNRPDDLRATDFGGYASTGSFLSKDEREAINKKLAHLTYEAVRQAKIKTNPRMWNVAELVQRAGTRMIHFALHLEKVFVSNATMVASVKDFRRVTDKMLAEVRNMAAAEMMITD